MPKLAVGKFELKDVVDWYAENIFSQSTDTDEMSGAKLEYWQAKARTEKVKADLAEEESMKIDEFRRAWAWRVNEMSSGLGAITLRIAPLIAGKSETEVRSLLDKELWKIRDNFARSGKFTPGEDDDVV